MHQIMSITLDNFVQESFILKLLYPNAQVWPVGSAKETNDHTFFNYPVLNLPRVGAVLVNKLSNEPTKDIAFSGNKWIASDDDDSDGVPNSLDMFPIDPSKNKDVDFDGVEDSLDATLSEFQFNWTKYLDKSMFSAYEKNKLN